MKNLINNIRGRKYLFLTVKIAILLLLVMILDFSIGSILQHYYFKQTSGFLHRTTYAIEKARADILIFGSSRALHHYAPDVLEQKTKMTCYNVGAAGQSFYYHYALYKAIKKRYIPKVIIFDFKNFEFMDSKKDDERITALLPYYRSHPEIHPIIATKCPYENIKVVSKIYPYNSLLLKIVIGNMPSNKTRGESENDIKGYVPLSRSWTDPVWVDTARQEYEIDSRKIAYFEEFMDDCKNSGIKLILIVSPYYNKQVYPDPSVQIGRDIAAKHNIPFYDFTNASQIATNSNLFSDPIHMNSKGAESFSGIIAKIINPSTEGERGPVLANKN